LYQTDFIKGHCLMANTFGTFFRVTTFGESHCKGVGAIIDGCPPLLALSEADIQPMLDRRRPGQSDLTTPRDESDRVTILSGVENGMTLGTPIALLVPNQDQRPGDYAEMADIPRPSHADFTYFKKYGIKASSGGGRSSARETIGRVAAGAIAEKILKERYGIEIVAWANSIGNIASGPVDMLSISRTAVDASIVRCPDLQASGTMVALINEVKQDNDSIGGSIMCVCRNVPVGWGDPVFDKLEARLAAAMLSLPATKGFEIGSGFAGTALRGSVHNDPFISKNGSLGTLTNNSGGIQGGISNGEPIYFKVAFKPPATIGKDQLTADFAGNPTVLKAKGRHDPCVIPRAVPIVEAMASLVLVDCALSQRSIAV
jgi:chorismate synthase